MTLWLPWPVCGASGSLLDGEASVGPLLSDLALALGLDAQEQYQALGPALYAKPADALQSA